VLAVAAILGVAIVAFGVAAGPLRVVVRIVVRVLAMPLQRGGWYVWLATVNGVLLVTVTALPVAVLTAWALTRRRRAAGVRWARRRS
jgi:hypothetical protein